ERVRMGAKYDVVLTNILNFLELKKKSGKIFPIVRISFVKTALNEHEIQQWHDFWKEKVDYLAVQEYVTPVLDGSRDNLIPKTSLRTKVPLSEITCRQPFQRAIVRGDGEILPCCSAYGTRISIGNIMKEASLRQIWYGKKAQDLRRQFLENIWSRHPVCSKCLNIVYGLDSSD
ncbi:MAG: SPASM domain-containing protein, partial [Candidatus Omnitrophota bacterium]